MVDLGRLVVVAVVKEETKQLGSGTFLIPLSSILVSLLSSIGVKGGAEGDKG